MNPLELSSRITVLPIIHGSGDFAVEVRRRLLAEPFDCVAVPLPPSFQADVERAIDHLPQISLVMQEEPRDWSASAWTGEASTDRRVASYVPVDPCQGVIAALRIAREEHMARAFIDLETAHFEVYHAVMPDPYALKKVRAEAFAAAVLPSIGPLPAGQPRDRVRHMARQLRELERRYRRICCVCALGDWPWLCDAYRQGAAPGVAPDEVAATEIYAVDPSTSLFVLGELPYITGLYERARHELETDDNLSIDGVKSLLLTARDRYRQEFGQRARTISPKLLQIYFQYVRNLALLDRRLTPSMYQLVIAAQQIFGDQFAITLTEALREYPYGGQSPFPAVRCSVGRARLPDGDVVWLKTRLPGVAISWRTCRLKPKPVPIDQRQWRLRWNPFSQCSWPPEDVAIEKFRTHVKDAALALLGNDLARSEKFTTSLKDGLDIRETLRNWHTGDLYVKVCPPNRGSLDCVVMLFDVPADPRDYPWRVTWHAEHHDESTLALFATDFRSHMVGPGIGQATYGGAVFLFPPRPIPDIWHDPRFDFVDTLEERLLAAACFHARERHIAVLSAAIPGLGWKQLARRFGKKLIHVPLNRFSQEQIQQLRMFHVLNGKQVRSYAAHFIRKA
uniref:Uncharacterized protein n=1 Tax=Schlesneria paludicola TaxID=360056 RepID=A0A7C4QWS5_9PLAN